MSNNPNEPLATVLGRMEKLALRLSTASLSQDRYSSTDVATFSQHLRDIKAVREAVEKLQHCDCGEALTCPACTAISDFFGRRGM